MPTYAYRGIECPHEFETHQSFSEDPLTDCIECGMPVRRVIQLPGIVFKGSGWYITDSRSGGEKAASTAKATPATSDSSKSGNGSSDSTKTPAAPAAESTAASTTGSAPASASTATATKD